VNPIIYEGVRISLEHLEPITFGCPCADIHRDIRIGVTFLNHCFTEKFDRTKHSEAQIVIRDGGSRPRVFSPARYALSFRLRELVSSFPGKRVFQTAASRNYVYAAPLDIAGKTYEVFFMLQRDKAKDLDLRLTVESAYPADGRLALRNRPRAIRFNVLAFKILKGEQIRFAAR
jgi:hypothetical protein